MTTLKIGDKAPKFCSLNQNKEKICLSDFLGKKLVLFFYPKASTPGCTIEGQEFRDEFQKFQDKNTVILGMSADSVKSSSSVIDIPAFLRRQEVEEPEEA